MSLADIARQNRWKTLTENDINDLYRRFGVERFNVTSMYDSEPRFIVTTPRCEYCGEFRHDAVCGACGAPARGAEK